MRTNFGTTIAFVGHLWYNICIEIWRKNWMFLMVVCVRFANKYARELASTTPPNVPNKKVVHSLSTRKSQANNKLSTDTILDISGHLGCFLGKNGSKMLKMTAKVQKVKTNPQSHNA